MQLKHHITLFVFIFLIVILLGSCAYHYTEGWNWLDSFYFVVITVTTIGYGDLAPKTNLGKIFTVFFAFFGVAMAFYLLSVISKNILNKDFHRRKKKK